MRWWEPTVFRWHLGVAVLQMANGVAVGWVDGTLALPFVLLTALSVVALSQVSPLIGFVLAGLHGHGGIPKEEAPRQAGAFPGLAWFEFESKPGQTFFVRNEKEVSELRSRASRWAAANLYRWTLDGKAVTLPTGGLANLQNGCAMLLASMVWLPVMGGDHLYEWATTGRVVAASKNVLPLLGMVALAAAVYVLLSTIVRLTANDWAGWRHSSSVELEGDLLRVDGRTFHVGHPNVETFLTWDSTGAVLRLTNDSETMVVRGVHERIQNLRACVDARRSVNADTDADADMDVARLAGMHQLLDGVRGG